LIDEVTTISLETILNVVYGIRWDRNQANKSTSNTRPEQEAEQVLNAPLNSEAGVENMEDITRNVQRWRMARKIRTSQTQMPSD
jgi:hypothetical protein